jgi:predicted metal-binding membrane protein
MLARLLERDRAIVLGGVVGLAALAWLDLWRRAGQMGMGTGMEPAMPRQMPWSPADLGTAAAMWGVMMVAMMLPSVAPVLLLYSTAQRKRCGEAQAARLVGCFAAGYLLVWLAWSALAAGLQGALQMLALLSPHLATTSARWCAAFLLLAGLYQLTPWKNACLVQCQSPLGFFFTHWRDGAWGATRMGMHHGAYCLGCCWALMGLLFVGGVMNLAWVAALAGFILLEKAAARGPWPSRLTGAAMMAWGLVLLVKGPGH